MVPSSDRQVNLYDAVLSGVRTYPAFRVAGRKPTGSRVRGPSSWKSETVPGRFQMVCRFVLAAVLACGLQPLWSQAPFSGVTSAVATTGITLTGPLGVVVSPTETIFIADTGANRIVQVTANGTASPLTITGLTAPDTLNAPAGLALDSAGDLYIADSGNSRIVMVTPSGAGSVVSTGAETLIAPQGLVLDASGNLFIADTYNNRIVEVTAAGVASVYTYTGSGTELYMPIGLAEDSSGNLYIADSGNARIVEVTSAAVGSVVAITDTTPAHPVAVGVDSYGVLYISDEGDTSQVIQVKGGKGLALTTGTLTAPAGLAVDVFGNVFVTESGSNNRVDSIQIAGVGRGHLQLGVTSGTSFLVPFTVGQDQATTLTNLTIWTMGEGLNDFGFGSVSSETSPCEATTYSSKSTCTIATRFVPSGPGLRQGGMILSFTIGGKAETTTVPLFGFGDSPQAALSPGTVSKLSTGSVSLGKPYQVAIDGSGYAYVTDTTNQKVFQIAAGGGSATSISTGPYSGVALDGAGDLFVANSTANNVVEVAAIMSGGGKPSTQLTVTAAGTALSGPTALATDTYGDLYIVDGGNNRIVKVRPPDVDPTVATESLTGAVVNTGSFSFTGNAVTALAFDALGNLYLTNTSANNVVEITPAGVSSVVSFPGLTLNKPEGIAVDLMGNIYVADAGNDRIVQLVGGVASVVPVQGLTNPATLGGGSASGQDIFGLGVDSSGNLYIADTENNRIVKVTVGGAALAFASTKVGSTSTDSPGTATVTNLGNQALAFSANPSYTTSFSKNAADTNLCTSTTSLAAGVNCDVSVNFTPQSVGSLSANVTLTDNSLNSSSATQRVAVSGTGLTPGDTTATAVTVTPSPTVVNGQTVTISAQVTDTISSSTTPTGTVTFIDTVGSTITPLNGGTPVTLSSGAAALQAVQLAGIGTHTITANYAGVTGSFLASSNVATVSLTKATVTIAGPATLPVSVASGQTGSVAITVTGPYTTIPVPSGTLSYSLLNSGSTSVASGTSPLTAGANSSSASIPIPNTLAPGSYTLSITYGGDSNYAATSTATTIAVLIGKITPTITWAPPSAIAYGSTLSGILNATAANGSASIAGTFTYTATPAGGSAIAVTSATVLGAAHYTLTATFTPTNTTTYTTATSTVTLTVSQITPAISLISSANPALVTTAVTFTATVAATSGTPTGSVAFYDGATLIGTVALSSGVAAYTTVSLAAATHSITAVYSGDSNFGTVTSAAVTEVVQDFGLSLSSGGNGTTQTVVPGGTATYALVLGPTNGATFPAAVTLSVSGLPPGATATLTPQTLPAGASLTNVTLTIQVPSTAAKAAPNPFLRRAAPVLLGLLLLPFASRLRKASRKLGVLLCLALLSMLGLLSVAGLASGCGGGNGFFAQASQTYVITITATSGSLQRSTTVTLIVQ